MDTAFDVTENHLLAALPPCARRRCLAQLEWIELPAGKVLHESGRVPGHVYFPTTAIVSLLCVMGDGACAEIAVVGREGVIGTSLFMGGDSTPSRAVVQSAGHAFRMERQSIKDEFNRGGPTMHVLLLYLQTLIAQIEQTAVCNRHHTLNQQLSRRLLSSLDRLHGKEIEMTQESIADMLGVRRESVTEGALELRAAGVIRYARGHISVLDRRGLEDRSCECYAVVRNEYDRLLPRKRRRASTAHIGDR